MMWYKNKFKLYPIVGLLLLTCSVKSEIIFIDSKDENVKFNPNPKQDFYFLTMDENIPKATLFIIENVEGDTPPYLSFTDEVNKCAAFESGYEIIKTENSSNYELHLRTSIDYEQRNCQQIKANINDRASKYKSFSLSINNLDDNYPQFLLSPKCEMKENTEYPLSSDPCPITLTDADGMLEKTNLFLIASNFDTHVNEYFDVSFKTIPNDADTQSEVVIFLKDGMQLDFESMNLHAFTLKAKQETNSNDVQVVVNVVDLPDQPPKWVQMFAIQQFEENVDQVFRVEAVDGDVQINNQINYEITENGCENFACSIEIDNEGIITVKNVDREETGDKILLTIRAIEDDGSNETALDITFFIQDQDDNSPKINIEKLQFNIDENYGGSISVFSVEDMDLGDSGTYDISLVSNGKVNYAEAFEVIPKTGYQKTDFTLIVHDSSKLDYEVDDWKEIKIELKSIEKADKSKFDTKNIIINLNDLNDEAPIFVNTDDSVSIKESIGKGEEIFDSKATDRDAGDKITYQIDGFWGQNLAIDDEGIISPKGDGVFDYEQLQQVVLQIRATDKDEVHTTFKLLTINVIDVDDEPPSITVGNNRIIIPENSEKGTQIQSSVTVSDPDSKPKLSIEIVWKQSFVTKNSAIVTTLNEDEWQCFEIHTDEHEESAQTFRAYLRINDRCSPDFELFDAITIYLKAIDENTEIGDKYSSNTILVNIEDVNDNAPVFVSSSLKGLEVTDGNQGGVRIGTITATDEDLNEDIRFVIKPLSEDADWVDIDLKTGKLTIKDGVTIDDDIPPREKISFQITAFDKDDTHQTPINIDIIINDVNDQIPQISNKIEKFSIKEQTEEFDNFISLVYEDNDRDDPFNKVKFKFDTNITNSAEMRFVITEDGKISIDLKNGATLDRDFGDDHFVLPILAYDNPSGTLQLEDHLDITIVLEDINNNSPEIVEKYLQCSENNKKGDILGPITTKDPDEDDNSRVKFEIKSVEPSTEQNPNVLSKSSFSISTTDDKTATITILQDLEGFYGTYNIKVKTTDYGKPPMSQDNMIQLTVKKFNFKVPKFVFPSGDIQKVVLSKDQIPSSDSALKLYNGEDLQDLEVDDSQNHKWEIDFQVIDENGNLPTLFTIKSLTAWKARLELQKSPSEYNKEYDITIGATLQGEHEKDEAVSTVQTHLKINFFDPTEPPTFSQNTAKISFEENSNGISQSIPQASFSADVDVKPYYLLMDETDTFKVDLTDGSVTLKQQLDYEKTPSYDIRIAASNSFILPSDITEASILHVKVDVININEYPPVFSMDKFVGAFLKSYNKQSIIVTIQASDEDSPDSNNLHFSIDSEANCKGLNPPNPAFSIGSSDGKVSPNFSLTSGMSGYCIFAVSVRDNEDLHGTVHTASTSVQINVISDDELVLFDFLNTDDDVQNEEKGINDRINDIFGEFGYESHLADYDYNKETAVTSANFFFLDMSTQNAIKASDIRGNLSDYIQFSKLQKSLAGIQIYLQSFPADNPIKDDEDLLKKWLLITTIILALSVIFLLITLFFRNRSLKRRINNLSTTKFGSQDSGLNRAGLAVPTTNKNAAEGSNPVFSFENPTKHETFTDRTSIISDDSDLFGVEDNPEFDA